MIDVKISSGRLTRSGLRDESNAALRYYERTIEPTQITETGVPTRLTPMYSGETPPLALRGYAVRYPQSLVEGYKLACTGYDRHFMSLVQRRKTSETDYRHAPFTLAFQVDGPAYSDEFLRQAASMHPTVLAEFITKRAFEFESNIAAYSLNSRLWPDGTTNGTWSATLDAVRQRTGKQVAVLAGSEQKLDEMLIYEMGVRRGEFIPPDRVRALTGFDAFLGPNDVLRLYQQNQGKDSPYVFYGRTSRPKSWLREPTSYVDEEFLADPEILRYVRAHAITHNFDDPRLPSEDPRVLMDTKEALTLIGSAHLVTHPRDIYSEQFLRHLVANGISIEDVVEGGLTNNKKNKLGGIFVNFPASNLLSDALKNHLQERGEDPELVARGERKVRVKPLKRHYGAYGHEVGQLNRSGFFNELMEQMRDRGHYVLQPEFTNLKLSDSTHSNKEMYIAIDRVFIVRGSNGELRPMESFRALMPASSIEGRKNNVHEVGDTRCARIVM